MWQAVSAVNSQEIGKYISDGGKQQLCCVLLTWRLRVMLYVQLNLLIFFSKS